MNKPSLRHRRSSKGVAGPLAGLLVLVTLVSACTQGLTPGNPALPPGFREALLPEADLKGYVYLSQEQPTSISNLYFLGDSSSEAPLGVPETSHVGHLALWVGGSTEQYAGKLALGDEQEARFVQGALEARAKQASLWVEQRGAEVYLAYGDEQWRQALQKAVAQGSFGTLEARYPDIWETVRLLPERPPLTPVAAGFLDVQAVLEGVLAQQAEVSAQGVTSALGVVRVDRAVFAVYSDQASSLPESISRDFLQEANLGVIFVAPSGYPGFLLGSLFSNFAGQAELTKVSLGESREAYYREMDGLHLLVQNAGSTVVFVVAADRDQGEALLLSTLR